ncbi:cold-regulated protein [Senna tora]|uniref:Cold-regulated protein n=1 Tax=Senna tora TaxID=362788 RepID=A0A834T7E5_9FABA|nr:cold-regulated protein [Senna tora]
MMGIGIPICVQCGTSSNPCRCKVVGPTVGFLAFAAAALVEWPVGALVYCFRHMKGRKIMAHPATVVYPSVTNSIPI